MWSVRSLRGGVNLLDRYDFYNTLIDGDSYETDLLRVSLTDKYNSANKTRFYNITEENWDSISNKPNQWISKTRVGLKEVIWMSGYPHVLVKLTEMWPSFGNTYYNFYNGSFGWSGWQYFTKTTTSSDVKGINIKNFGNGIGIDWYCTATMVPISAYICNIHLDLYLNAINSTSQLNIISTSELADDLGLTTLTFSSANTRYRGVSILVNPPVNTTSRTTNNTGSFSGYHITQDGVVFRYFLQNGNMTTGTWDRNSLISQNALKVQEFYELDIYGAFYTTPIATKG